MGYRSGPSPQDVRLTEPADLESVQVEPAEHAPESLSSLGEELDCQVVVRPLPSEEVQNAEEERVVDRVLEQREEEDVAVVRTSNYVPGEKEVEEQGPAEEEVQVCPPAKSPVCEAALCPMLLSTEEPERPEVVVTFEDDDAAVIEEGQVNRTREKEPELPTIIELDPASPAAPGPQSSAIEGAEDSDQEQKSKMTPDDTTLDFVSLSPASVIAPSPNQEPVAAPTKPLVPCYWSLELLIAAAFCTDVPPFPLYPHSTPSVVPSKPNPHHGMELLSELADLELQQQKRTSGKSQGEGQCVFLNTHNTHQHAHKNTILSAPNSRSLPSFSSASTETNSPSPPGLASVALRSLPDTPLFLLVLRASGGLQHLPREDVCMPACRVSSLVC